MQEQALRARAEELRGCRFPRWEQFPEIELYMDQLISLLTRYLGVFSPDDPKKLISPSIINNYVKQKLIPPPVNKRYTREHIAGLLMLCTLKQTLPLPVLGTLLADGRERYGLEESYRRFCEAQETYLHELADGFAACGDARAAALEMAMRSNAARLFAESAVALAQGPAPEKKEKPEKNR